MAFSRQERDEAAQRVRQQRVLLTVWVVLAVAVVCSAAVYRRRLARSAHNSGAPRTRVARTRVARTRAPGALPSSASAPASAPGSAPLTDPAP